MMMSHQDKEEEGQSIEKFNQATLLLSACSGGSVRARCNYEPSTCALLVIVGVEEEEKEELASTASSPALGDGSYAVRPL